MSDAPLAAPALFDLGTEMAQPQARRLLAGRVVWFTRGGPNLDRRNHDAVAVLGAPEGIVLAVADGVAGPPMGARASAVLLDELADQVARGDGRSLTDRIVQSVERTNRRLVANRPVACTTLALLAVESGEARPIHVGDSEILVVDAAGAVTLSIVAHSPVGLALAAGQLGRDEAMHRDDRHLISNCVGSRSMRVEVGEPVRLATTDTALVATDGLFDNLRFGEIVDRMRGASLEDVGSALLRDAMARMTEPEAGAPSKPDDLGFVLFRPEG